MHFWSSFYSLWIYIMYSYIYIFIYIYMTTPISIPSEPVFKTWDSNCPALIVQIKWLEHSAWIRRMGFEFPSDRDIFCLKNFDTFTRTSIRVSKMNAVARAQLTLPVRLLLDMMILCITIINLMILYIYIYISCINPTSVTLRQFLV